MRIFVAEEVGEETIRMLNIYADVGKNVLAILVVQK